MAEPTAPSADMPDAYDRLMGMLDGLNDVTRTKASTITVMPLMGVGGSSNFIVQTYRQRDGEGERSRDTIFLVVASPSGYHRLVLPSQVADAIARQRDSLTTTTRKKIGKERAAQLKAAGHKPNTAGLEAWRAKGSPRKRKKGKK